MVGKGGFEPPTPCSQSRCATELRHFPRVLPAEAYWHAGRVPVVPAALLDAIVDESDRRGAHIVGITGGIAVGKSTVATAVATILKVPTVSTDGFIRDDAGERKGYADSYDALALQAFIDAFRVDRRASAPRYSHLHYEVIAYEDIAGDGLVVDGLHLGHPALGLRTRIDLLVHLDAPTEVMGDWYLTRFQQLRTTARDDPTAMLYPYRDMDPDALDAMAMQVWRELNALVIDNEVRAYESVADMVVRLDAAHGVVDINLR